MTFNIFFEMPPDAMVKRCFRNLLAFFKDFSKLSLIINFYPTQHTNLAAVYIIFYSNNIGCIYFIHDIFTTILKITINIHTNIITHTIDSQNYMHTHDLPVRMI